MTILIINSLKFEIILLIIVNNIQPFLIVLLIIILTLFLIIDIIITTLNITQINKLIVILYIFTKLLPFLHRILTEYLIYIMLDSMLCLTNHLF